MVFEGCLCWPPEEDGEEAFDAQNINKRQSAFSLSLSSCKRANGSNGRTLLCLFLGKVPTVSLSLPFFAKHNRLGRLSSRLV